MPLPTQLVTRLLCWLKRMWRSQTGQLGAQTWPHWGPNGGLGPRHGWPPFHCARIAACCPLNMCCSLPKKVRTLVESILRRVRALLTDRADQTMYWWCGDMTEIMFNRFMKICSYAIWFSLMTPLFSALFNYCRVALTLFFVILPVS